MATSTENAEKTVKRLRSKHRAELKIEVLQYWDSDVSLQQIAKLVSCRQPTVKSIFTQAYGAEAVMSRKRRLYSLSKIGVLNPMTGKSGNLHHNFQGRASDSKGYYTVTTPKWCGKTTKRVYEHHVVWALGQGVDRVPEGYTIHHIDGNPGNNEFSNLVCMTPSAHTKLHAIFRRCNDYSERKYTQVGGSTASLLQPEDEIVCSE